VTLGGQGQDEHDHQGRGQAENPESRDTVLSGGQGHEDTFFLWLQVKSGRTESQESELVHDIRDPLASG
jgi:hypothetical protein